MLYQSHLTTPELIEIIKPMVGNKYIYCDSARPEIIEELKRAGINAFQANKNVKEGINWIRSNKVNIHKTSIDLQKEWRQYKWKSNSNGEIIDEPVKVFDDLCDSSRYGAISFKNAYTAPVLMGFR
jgi:phage terminase large subunit